MSEPTAPMKGAGAGQASSPAAKTGDCGCGCNGNGNGDCEEAKQPVNRARRSLMLGAGASTVVLISTLANRRAFAGGGAQCGPISHAASLHQSGNQNNNCGGVGGLTPGYWAQHQNVSAQVLGFQESSSSPTYSTDLKNFLTTTTLGSQLPALNTIDPTSADATFCKAFSRPRSDAAFHWANAILCALSSGPPSAYNYCPSYGYTITSLNQAIVNATNQGVSGTTILQALETLENDYNVSTPGGPALTVC